MSIFFIIIVVVDVIIIVVVIVALVKVYITFEFSPLDASPRCSVGLEELKTRRVHAFRRSKYDHRSQSCTDLLQLQRDR